MAQSDPNMALEMHKIYGLNILPKYSPVYNGVWGGKGKRAAVKIPI